MLNHDQLICLWGGIGVAVIMGLWPPWREYGQFVGYRALWNPPSSKSSIGAVRLLLQWVILASVTYGAILAVPRLRHAPHFPVPSERTVMPAAGDLGDALGGAFRRAAQ
jgi:hypothetical protein